MSCALKFLSGSRSLGAKLVILEVSMFTKNAVQIAIAGLVLGALFAGPGTGLAQTKEKTLKVVPLSYSKPDSGKQMFIDFCSACHGMDGKGNGPAVAFLKTPPTNLTKLAQRNKGKFPSTDFVGTLRFGTGAHPHGTVDMPMWGDLFTARNGSGQAAVRIANLMLYVESIQEK
jgi:mono/diheme cytochrome c family protein